MNSADAGAGNAGACPDTTDHGAISTALADQRVERADRCRLMVVVMIRHAGIAHVHRRRMHYIRLPTGGHGTARSQRGRGGLKAHAQRNQENQQMDGG